MDRSLSFQSRTGERQRAFTLIELLAVIVIIGILAAIAVGLTAAAKNARINSRGQADLKQLETAIEAYKGDRNSYPPDHRAPEGSEDKTIPIVNQLYYELTGTEVDRNGVFRPAGASTEVTGLKADDIETAFGRRGFLNASADPNERVRSYLEPKPSAIWQGTVNTASGTSREIQLLNSPFPWKPAWGALGATFNPSPRSPKEPNPWRYVSTSPTNNVRGFDLWTEVYVGDDKRIFKNW